MGVFHFFISCVSSASYMYCILLITSSGLYSTLKNEHNVYVVTTKLGFLCKKYKLKSLLGREIVGGKKTSLQVILHLDKPRLDSYNKHHAQFLTLNRAVAFKQCTCSIYSYEYDSQTLTGNL